MVSCVLEFAVLKICTEPNTTAKTADSFLQLPLIKYAKTVVLDSEDAALAGKLTATKKTKTTLHSLRSKQRREQKKHFNPKKDRQTHKLSRQLSSMLHLNVKYDFIVHEYIIV